MLQVLVGAKEVVRALVERGVSLEKRNGKGFTPLDLAEDDDIKSILLNEGNTRSSSMNNVAN